MLNSILDSLLVVLGIGVAVWLWHGIRHWAAGPIAILFGIAIALASLFASWITALVFSELTTWDPLARPKTFAAVVSGATMALCGTLISFLYALRGVWNLIRRKYRV